MKTRMIVMAAAAALLLSGCRHKDLLYEEPLTSGVKVVFDWRKAPEAHPASMVLYMYDASTGTPLRYMFTGRDGGSITIPHAKYNALGMNSDDTDWARFRDSGDIEQFELFTGDASNLGAYGLDPSTLPRARDAEDERMAITPGMLWSTRSDGIDLTAAIGGVTTITLYPEEAVCHYTVDVEEVNNIRYINGASADATISGMADGVNCGTRDATDQKVTMPFVLSTDKENSRLHAEFLTFGECSHVDSSHHLTVYLHLNDGTRWYADFDVTSQVADAPDPHHVHIIVKGLDVPAPTGESSGSGFRPNINDWQAVDVNLKM